VGGGFFAHFSLLPVSLAWDAFGEKNGAHSLAEMRTRIEKYRKGRSDPFENYTIGCILLEQPFFLPQERWIPVSSDWSRNIVRGKGYDLSEGAGRRLWDRLQEALQGAIPRSTSPEPVAAGAGRFGSPVLQRPRLGQGSFRVMVTDAYRRRCAVTGERVLPALEAAHIRPYGQGGEHRVDNGLLLRRDVHSLFDLGYLTVTPDHHVECSRRMKEEYENGREYYKLHGGLILRPEDPSQVPSPDFLRWHNETVYRP
jgi:putative restriction endonuclease